MAINWLGAGDPPEPAGHRVDGVDGPPADGLLNQVSQPLEPQPQHDGGGMLGSHGNGAGAVEVVRHGQEEQVQGVTLNALAAQQQFAQEIRLRAHLDAQGVLRGLERGQGMRRRADGADARNDGRNFVVAASAHQALQQARAFEHVEAHVGDGVAFQFHGDAPVSFHAG